MPARAALTMWTECATATVITMIGHAGVGGIEHRADPASEPHGGVDDEHEHDDEGQGAEHRAQQDGGGNHDDQKHDRRQGLQVVLRGLGEGTVHDHVAGQVVGHVGWLVRASSRRASR